MGYNLMTGTRATATCMNATGLYLESGEVMLLQLLVSNIESLIVAVK